MKQIKCEYKNERGYCDSPISCSEMDMDDTGIQFCGNDKVNPQPKRR